MYVRPTPVTVTIDNFRQFKTNSSDLSILDVLLSVSDMFVSAWMMGVKTIFSNLNKEAVRYQIVHPSQTPPRSPLPAPLLELVRVPLEYIPITKDRLFHSIFSGGG